MALIDSLISAWELGSDFNDSHGSNHLTNNGSVGFGTITGGLAAADFNGTDQYLSHADNAALSVGDFNFTWEVTFELDTSSGDVPILVKDSAFQPYQIHYFNAGAAEEMVFDAYFNNRVSQVVPSAEGVRLHVIGWYDADTNVNGLIVNGGAPVTAAHGAFTPPDDAGPFHIGRNADQSIWLNGRVARVRFWKRLLTLDVEAPWLFNGATGRSYAEIVAGMGEPAPGLPFITTLDAKRMR